MKIVVTASSALPSLTPLSTTLKDIWAFWIKLADPGLSMPILSAR